MFVGLLQKYLHKQERTSAQTENKGTSSISRSGIRVLISDPISNRAFSGRKARLLQMFILTFGCQSGDYPCPWFRFWPLHLKLSLNLIQIANMGGKQNHRKYIFSKGINTTCQQQSSFQKHHVQLQQRLVVTSLMLTNPSSIETNCLSDHTEWCILFYLLKGVKPTLLP